MHLTVYQVISFGVIVWFLMSWVEGLVALFVALKKENFVMIKELKRPMYIYSIIVVIAITVFMSGFVK